MLKSFVISSAYIESIIHDNIKRYKFGFNKEKEIFKPTGTLTEFVKMVEKLLIDNDLKRQLDLCREENLKLKNQLLEIKMS